MSFESIFNRWVGYSNGIDNKSIPIGVGFIAAYCKKIHKEAVEVKVFRTFKQFWDDARAEVESDGGYILEYGNIIITHQLKEFELSMLLADLADLAKSTENPSSN